MTPAPAAVVVARAPSAGAAPELEALLGRTRSAALQAVLIRRAVAWAAAAAPGAAFVAVVPAAALGEVGALLPAGVTAFGQEDRGPARDPVTGAVARIGRGPLLIVDPACPRLGAAHAAAALGDLAAGCDVVFGSTLAGGWYLAALREPRPELLAVARDGRQRAGGLGRMLERARALRAEVGLLRHERVLATPGDAAALLADPLLSDDVRALLVTA